MHLNNPMYKASLGSILVKAFAVVCIASVSLASIAFADDQDVGSLVVAEFSTNSTRANPTVTIEGVGTYTYKITDAANNIVQVTKFNRGADEEELQEYTLPTKLEVDDVTYTVGSIKLAANSSSFKAKKIIIPAGVEVLGLNFLNVDGVGTERLVIEPGAMVSTLPLTCAEDNALRYLDIGSGASVSIQMTIPTLENVSIGDNVQFTGNFTGCSALTAIDLNGLALTVNMFRGCSSLSDVIGWSGNQIPEYAFYGCKNLKSFDFSNVITVGDYAFMDSGLEGYLDLPKCTSLGNQSFQGCSIASVVLGTAQTEVPNISPFNQCESLLSLTINGTIPDGSRTGLFGNCPNLNHIIIGESVESIGRETFYGSGESAVIDNRSSSMLYGEDYRLRNSDGEQVYPWLAKPIAAPTVLTGLGDTYTLDGGNTYLYFYNNGVLTIPASIEEIPEGALAGFVFANGALEVAKINEIDLAEENNSFILDNGILYDKNRTTLYKATVDVTSVSVPNTVTAIGTAAFQYCNKLTSIELPDGLKRIGGTAFEGCASLTSIDIPDSVEIIGSAAFAYCVRLTSFTAGGNLWTKSNLSDFVAEGGVPGINKLFISYAAADEWQLWESNLLNTSLVELNLSGLKSSFIPHYSFSGLAGITEVLIPAGVSQIGNGSFYYCKNLKDIYIYNPTSITIATSSGGQGDSGSGNPDETYAVSQPGSFAWWNNERPADASGTGAKYEDYTGLNFYGAAYSGNNLVKFCQNMQHNFIPVVILDNLDAAANPFATDAQTEYDLTYGTGANDYGYVAIADIQAGETPAVMAYFGDYGTPRDLTNDAACTITYYGPDGKATTSFTNAGTYTAFIEGDGKSVFGERTVSFQVKGADNPPAPAPAEKAVSLSSAVVSGVSGKTYTGKAQTQSPVVKVGGKTLVAGTDYTVAYKNNVNAGTATMTITGKGKYTGSKSVTFAIAKASQKITAKSFKVTYKGGKLIKEGKLAKARTIKVKGKAKVSAKTAVKFKKANKAGGKKIKVNAKTGKITVKKGLKAGTYKVKVKITAAEGANYKAAKAKTITVRVIVKNK